MRLCLVLSVCQLILIGTHVTDRALERLGVRRAAAALTAVAVLLTTGWELPILTDCAVHPAALLLPALAVWLCRRRPVGSALMAAAVSGIVACWAVSTFPDALEQGMLMGLPAALAAMLFADARQGLLCAVLAPVVCGFCMAVQDWYLFDMFYLRLGSAVQLDAILFAGTALMLRLCLPPVRRTDSARGNPVEAQQKA